MAEILSVDYELFGSLLPNTFLEGGMPDGSFFESDGFKPVILGYGYKHAFDIGDTFISDNEIFKCRVVGILDKGSKWFSANYGLSDEIVNIDNFIIVLTNQPDTYIGATFEGTVLANNYLISKEPFDSELESKIGEVAKKYGISVGIYTFNEFFANTRGNLTEQYYLMLFSILFLSVIAVFGLSSLIVYGINISKREIGIRMACGAETKHIMRIFCSEIFIIIILAFFTSCIMANSKRLINFLMLSMKDINIWVYAAVLVISLVVCVVSCIFPIRRITKLEPKELTGGE
jgi:putative ABC transport system permease protein